MHERVRDSYEFPVDLPDDPDAGAGALRWTASVIALATLLLALTNAQALSGWAAEFEPGPRTIALADAADRWEEAMADLGLGAGRAQLHKAWKRLERARWSGNGREIEEARR